VKGKRRRKRIRHDWSTRLSVGWYKPEDWDRLRDISEDRDELEDTFEEWESYALKALQEIESTGQILEKVMIDPEQLLRWCNSKGVAVNGSSRAEFAAWLMNNDQSKT